MPGPLCFAPNGDHITAYRDSGTGPAVVFAHEKGFDHSIWEAALALLPKGLRLIRYDLRGHGGSSTPPSPYAMGALVRDAEALLDHLKIENSVFVGSGLGGMVAQGLGVKRLDQIRALVLANTAPRIGSKARWDKAIEDLQTQGIQAAAQADMTTHFSPRFRQSAAIAPWAALRHAQRPEAVLGSIAAMSGTDFYTTTAGLRLPALVIASSEDRVTPADMARELADLIPGARFALIRRAGHLPMIEAPEAFAATLAEFLRSIGHI